MAFDHDEASREEAVELETMQVIAPEASVAESGEASCNGMGAEVPNRATLLLSPCESGADPFLPSDNPGVHPVAKKRARFSAARSAVALAVVAFVLVGLAFHVGTGTPSALGIGQIAAICPLGALEALFGAKELMLHPIVLLALVVVAVVLVGKAFCSWMCPVPWLRKFFAPNNKAKRGAATAEGDSADGAMVAGAAEASEAAGAAGVEPARAACAAEGRDAEQCGDVDSEEIAKQADNLVKSLHAQQAGDSAETNACASCGAGCALSPVGGKRDGMQVDSRHAVLAGTLVSAAVFGFPVFCLICPVGLTFATLIGVWNLFHFNEPSWALVAFPAILLFEVVFLKKWCSKICPISALVSLISNANATLKPRVDKGHCLRERGIDCHACVDACPEQLDPHSRRIPECSKCGKCVEACPAHAISIKLK